MGKAIAVKGSMCTGHGQYPPRANSSWSPNVFVGGKNIHRQGDSWEEHCSPTDCHSGVTVEASSTVFCNGKRVARVGDSINCGSKIATGVDNIRVGD